MHTFPVAFAGEWSKETATNDPTSSKSRTGQVINYAGCPLTLDSKLLGVCVKKKNFLRDLIDYLKTVRSEASASLYQHI